MNSYRAKETLESAVEERILEVAQELRETRAGCPVSKQAAVGHENSTNKMAQPQPREPILLA